MQDRKDILLPVFTRLGDYAAKYGVISEGELRWLIREALKSLTRDDRAELEKRLEGDLEDIIFRSITSRDDKISLFSPDMQTKVNYQGEIFYCLPTHRYMSAELEEAFLRWSALKNPVDTLKDVVIEFMNKAGYHIQEQKSSLLSGYRYIELFAIKSSEKHIRIAVLSSIKFVPRLMNDAITTTIDAIAVPTESTPAPFISFFREYDVGDTVIWVVDVEKRTLDPFIGIAPDDDIEANFANPEKARKAVSVWMKKMSMLDF